MLFFKDLFPFLQQKYTMLDNNNPTTINIIEQLNIILPILINRLFNTLEKLSLIISRFSTSIFSYIKNLINISIIPTLINIESKYFTLHNIVSIKTINNNTLTIIVALFNKLLDFFTIPTKLSSFLYKQN